MKKLINKCFTKPIWWWEKRRQYPIREKIFKLPIGPVCPWDKEPARPCTLVICATPTTLSDAAWAASSIIRNVQRKMGLVIVSEAFPPERREQLLKLFPSVRLLTDDEISITANPIEFRHILRLGAYHPMGRKLLAILKLQQNSDIIFSDADVLAFQRLHEVEAALDSGSIGLHVQDVELPLESESLRNAKSMGLVAHPRFSCGFMFIPRESLDTALADRLLDTNAEITSWFPDTMVLAFLMAKAGAKPLPDASYVQDVRRQFFNEIDVDYDQIALRHFVGPVRHLMYSRGMPRVCRALLEGPLAGDLKAK